MSLRTRLANIPVPSRQAVMDAQGGFAGGLNSVADPAALLPGQARQLANSRLTAAGAALRRGGTQRTSTAEVTLGTISGGIYWPAASGIIVSRQTAGGIWTTTYGAFPRTFTALPMAGETVPADPIFAPFVNSGGTSLLFVPLQAAANLGSIGTGFGGLTTYSAAPTGLDGLVVYNERLWGWDGTTNSLFFSALNAGETLGIGASGGGFILVRTFGAEAIKQAVVVGSSLLLFHRQGVSRVTGFGQSDITVAPQAVSSELAVVSGRAVCTYDNVAYAVTMQGLYVVTENGAAPVATAERPDPLVPVLEANPTLAANIQTVFHRAKNEVWVNFRGVGVYVFDTIRGAWTGPFTGEYTSPGAAVLFEVRDLNNLPHLWKGDTSGWVSECDIGTKDQVAANGTGGTAITQTIQCRRLFGPGTGRTAVKAWTKANVLATLTSGGTAPTLASSSVAGGSNSVTFTTPSSVEQQYYAAVGGAGPYVDITITDAATAASQYADVEVDGWLLGRR